MYVDWVKKHNIPETGLRVYRRYLRLCPEEAEDFVDYLKDQGKLDDAAVLLGKIVNDQNFVSKKGKSNHTLWHELCEMISKNPNQIKSLNVDAIIRGGLRRYTDQVGHLWNSLADYYIRSGLFERARDIYEEAIQTVNTVRDFTHIFDAYAQFEELALSKMMEQEMNEDDTATLDLYMARYEDLIDRRPLLLNSVLLRQNPHNVSEWQNRVELYKQKDKLNEMINTYTEAVQTVDPKQAVGKLHHLWVNFAKFYEEHRSSRNHPSSPFCSCLLEYTASSHSIQRKRHENILEVGLTALDVRAGNRKKMKEEKILQISLTIFCFDDLIFALDVNVE